MAQTLNLSFDDKFKTALVNYLFVNNSSLTFEVSGVSGTYTGSTTYTVAPTSGVIDITSDVVITIPSGETISYVNLYFGGIKLAGVAFEKSYPDGGDVIISGYQISVV